jgi:hypothetical protein
MINSLIENTKFNNAIRIKKVIFKNEDQAEFSQMYSTFEGIVINLRGG